MAESTDGTFPGQYVSCGGEGEGGRGGGKGLEFEKVGRPGRCKHPVGGTAPKRGRNRTASCCSAAVIRFGVYAQEKFRMASLRLYPRLQSINT